MTDSDFKRHLEYYINKGSDRYRSTASKAPKDHGLLKKARQVGGEVAHTISAYLPEPGGKYQPAIQHNKPTVKVNPTTPL